MACSIFELARKVGLTGLALFALTVSIQYSIDYIAPPTRWVVAHSVAIDDPRVNVESGIHTRLMMEIRRPVTIRRHSLLTCREGGRLSRSHTSEAVSEVSYVAPSWVGFEPDEMPAGVGPGVRREIGEKKYQGASPRTPADCEMVVTLRWNPNPLIAKGVQLSTGKFRVVSGREGS